MTDLAGGVMDDGFAGAADPVRLGWLELNDRGNAERLIARAAGRLAHVPERGWLAFDGVRWSADDGERLAYAFANEAAMGMAAEAEAIDRQARQLADAGDEERSKRAVKRAGALRAYSIDSGNLSRIRSMLGQAEMMLSASAESFDADPLAWATPGGLLRARRQAGDTVRFWIEPNAPAHRVTRALAVAWDRTASAPQWEACLRAWLPDEGERRFVQTALGYAITGHIHEQCMFVFQGRGRDGKSTMMNVVRRILGSYAAAADVRSFLDGGGMRSGADASPDLARLSGDVRLVSTSEPPRGARLNESLIKAVTGGAPITARRLQKDIFEYVPRFKLFLECNARPVIRGDDDGIWRRIQLVMFRHQIPPDLVDKGLEQRLFELEGPGILNWLLQGLETYLLEGLQPPATVTEAVEDYRKGSNPFGEWFGLRVEPDPDHRCEAGLLYEDYRTWSESQGYEPMKQRAFGDALADRQVIRSGLSPKGRVIRRGARLRHAPPDGAAFDDPGGVDAW